MPHIFLSRRILECYPGDNSNYNDDIAYMDEDSFADDLESMAQVFIWIAMEYDEPQRRVKKRAPFWLQIETLSPGRSVPLRQNLWSDGLNPLRIGEFSPYFKNNVFTTLFKGTRSIMISLGSKDREENEAGRADTYDGLLLCINAAIDSLRQDTIEDKKGDLKAGEGGGGTVKPRVRYSARNPRPLPSTGQSGTASGSKEPASGPKRKHPNDDDEDVEVLKKLKSKTSE